MFASMTDTNCHRSSEMHLRNKTTIIFGILLAYFDQFEILQPVVEREELQWTGCTPTPFTFKMNSSLF